MTLFDTFLMVDWSGGNDTGPSPRKDAIWACAARGGVAEDPVYLRNRTVAEAWIADRIAHERGAGRRVMAGFDFPFAYPDGFAKDLGATDKRPGPMALWELLAGRVEDTPQANNRFDLAADINRALGQGRGPFWGNGLKRDIPGLPRTKAGYANPYPEKRPCEALAKGAFTCWQLAGAGAVGSQVLMGLPVLHRLRLRFGGDIAVWPFEPLERPVALVEIWPSLFVGPAPVGMIKDAWQVQQVARVLSDLPARLLAPMLDVGAPDEGWILGVGNGHEEMLRDHARYAA